VRLTRETCAAASQSKQPDCERNFIFWKSESLSDFLPVPVQVKIESMDTTCETQNAAASQLTDPLGAVLTADGMCKFLVWAPHAKSVEIIVYGGQERVLPMEPLSDGYFGASARDISAGALYKYRLDGQNARPDPASRFQPQGVHGPSQVVDTRFDWSDADWRGIPLSKYVVYELHVGTFTREGTFDAIISRIAELKEIGITAIEIMPVAQFPGARNWGYDGVYPFAVQDAYGGPHGLKRLVDTCHQQGMAVVLDVVYNHFGPEGNYVGEFAPYFTHEYHTPWGDALNFDGPHSDEVRRYFIENALQWIEEFHMDALRLDAIHAIIDPSARSFLEELGVACHAAGEKLDRQVFLIAENNRNDPRVVRSREMGGRGLDCEWNDDFHHSLHVVLTGEQNGYYEDYGGVGELAIAIRDGFVFTGQYSKFRQKRYGKASTGMPGESLTVYSQNHDQVGNRMRGDRLAERLSFDQLRLAAGTVLLSPYIPLLFMGEEYGERTPFQYFVSHDDSELIEAVRKGRAEEFRCFGWSDDLPDPQDEQTFLRSKLNWKLKDQGAHQTLRNFYAELLRLRRQLPALARLDKNQQHVIAMPDQNVVFVERGHGSNPALILFHFGDGQVNARIPAPAGTWQKLLDSADSRWGTGGSITPDTATSSGEMELPIGPWALCMFIEA